MAVKYYAVRVGRSTGVFFSWAECQKQVTGFPGAVFKSFLTIEEAEAFVRSEVAQVRENSLTYGDCSLTAYVDGSFSEAEQAFSYGMVLLDGKEELTFSERFAEPELAAMRNVAGEIKGAEAAMRYAVANKYTRLYLYHDYEGIAKWCQGIWRANKEGTKAYKEYYDSISDRLEVVFVKVAAHTGDTYNELADKLAKQALCQKLPND